MKIHNILFVLDDFYPVNSAGAVRILSLAEELRDQNLDLVGGANKTVSDRNFPFKVYFVRRPSERRPLAFAFFLIRFSIRALFLSLIRRYDSIVVSIPKYEVLFLMPLLKWRTPKLVLDIRDAHTFVDYSYYSAHFLPKPLANLFGKMMKVVTRHLLSRALVAADFISAANSAILQAVQQYQHKAVLISNGVDTETFQPGEKSTNGNLNLVYLGNFAEKDRFDYLLVVLPKWCDSIQLHLIGEGRNKQRILREFDKHQIRYQDHGSVDHKALPNLLSMMDVGFIFREETAVDSIPVAIYEFSAMNIPTLTNRVGLMADLVEKYRLGKVISSASDLEEFLRLVVTNRSSLNEYSGLHRLACNNFSRKVHAKTFREHLLK